MGFVSTSGGSYNTLFVAPLPHTPKTSNVVVIPAFRGHLVRQSIYGQSVHAGPCIVDPVQDNPFYDPPTRHQIPIWSTTLNGQGKFLYL